VHQHRSGMYQKFGSVGKLSGVPAGKSGDTGGWETGAAGVGMPAMGLEAMGPDVCLLLV
jgi:hypothetical protein